MGRRIVKLLLDTHALLWWWADSPHLSAEARHAITSADNEVLVSVASAWEMAIKQRAGKLAGAPTDEADFAAQLSLNDFQTLPITLRHVLRAGSHPAEHRDPFDRLLAAQAEIEGAVLVTRDAAMAGFGVRVLW